MKILSDQEYKKMLKLIKDQNDALEEAIDLLHQAHSIIKNYEVNHKVNIDFPNSKQRRFDD